MAITTVSAVKVTSPVVFEFTEHNRSSLPIQYEQIETTQRMANGTMRKFVVAKKKTIQLAWSMLPSRTNLTVDGKYGAEGIKDLYDTYCFKPLTVELRYHQSTPTSFSSDNSAEVSSLTAETLTMFISGFSYDVKKRLNDSGSTGFDYVDVSISFTEV